MKTPPDHDVVRFDRWSTTYDRSPAQRLFFTRVHRAVCDELLSQGEVPLQIVDVGCGTGRLLATLLQRLPAAELVGVDPSEGMITVAHARFADEPRVRLETAKASALPLPDRSVDAVVTTVSFHHWDDQASSLEEVARVLRRGGRLLIADVFAIGVIGGIVERLGGHHGRGYRSEAELSALVGGAGLTCTRRRQLFGPVSPLFVIEARLDDAHPRAAGRAPASRA